MTDSKINGIIKNLPKKTGVYIFQGKKGLILYIGKAVSVKDRVKSYFRNDLEETRSPLIGEMVKKITDIKYRLTDSALEALILETALIKKHQPRYNIREKDDKSFNYIVITKESFPRVLLERGKSISFSKLETKNYKLQTIFGPFPQGKTLKDALKIVRKIFPFRDKCTPYEELKDKNKTKPCFMSQIGLCPEICSGKISKKEYLKNIRNINLFLSGRKKRVIENLRKDMKMFVSKQEFEKAGVLRNKIFALEHIQDVSLLSKGFSKDNIRSGNNEFRIEAYDISHTAGSFVVGAMVVMENGEYIKNEYRKFKIRGNIEVNDPASLKEIMERRFKHKDWKSPNLIVVDGATAQKRTAEKVLRLYKLQIPVVAVTKDERHKAREIVGDRKYIKDSKELILKANLESHRFVIAYHRKLRGQIK